MLCDKCKKNEATVHIVQVLLGQEKKSMHLCQSCFAQQSAGMQGEGGIDLSQVMEGMPPEVAQSLVASAGNAEEDEGEVITCSGCGLDSRQFRKTGRLGCVACYDAFAAMLTPMLAGLHRGMHHVARTAGGAGSDIRSDLLLAERSALEAELDAAIAAEAYERAAELRDRLESIAPNRQEGSRS